MDREIQTCFSPVNKTWKLRLYNFLSISQDGKATFFDHIAEMKTKPTPCQIIYPILYILKHAYNYDLKICGIPIESTLVLTIVIYFTFGSNYKLKLRYSTVS